jgi:NitT/TauT family transport system substrate-binding protein
MLLGAIALAVPFGAALAAPPLRIALSSTPHASLLHLAAAQGYFDAEGLQVTLVPVSHGKAALDKLAQGQADLAAAAELPFIVSVLQGQPWSVAAAVASESGEMAVVARRDRGIAGPTDLANKRVGVTLGTSGEYFLWAWLIRHRLAPDAVAMTNLPPPQMVGALAQGTVDAVSVWQPVRREAEQALGAGGISFTAPDAYTVTHVIVGRQDYLRGNTQAMRQLMRALLRAERFLRTQPQAALAATAARLGIAPDELRSQWAALDLRVEQRQSQLITWEDEARWAMTSGHAAQRPVPNLLPHLYLDALEAEAPHRVTVVR